MADLNTLLYSAPDAAGNGGGLLPYLEARLALDFERFNVRPYGFEPPEAFDPDAGGTGIRIADPSPINAGDRESIHGLIMSKTVRLGRIVESQPRFTDWELQVSDLYDRVANAIVHWGHCYAVTPQMNGVQLTGGAIERVASSLVASSRRRSLWHILVWNIQIVHTTMD